jgi:hypothetical protein
MWRSPWLQQRPWHAAGRVALLPVLLAEEDLERQEGPQSVPLFGTPSGVRTHEPIERLSVNMVSDACTGAKHCRRVARKVFSEPAIERDAEASFAATQYLCGEKVP